MADSEGDGFRGWVRERVGFTAKEEKNNHEQTTGVWMDKILESSNVEGRWIPWDQSGQVLRIMRQNQTNVGNKDTKGLCCGCGMPRGPSNVAFFTIWLFLRLLSADPRDKTSDVNAFYWREENKFG
ncbi:unnamed protein product [Sphenostylis stenocarpa]|uniref:Uncharacterized protein n=1 Tax=Sphenostylis stenocarpa TaxID=92480 RepID=A0AA86V0T4_9FABA|nr:unnamed protein product [Sphenostylis stenocarpa]